MPALIEDYALVGDGHTAALISRDGSVDWLCWPRFDSGACFAALLGTEKNGRWLIAPASPETDGAEESDEAKGTKGAEGSEDSGKSSSSSTSGKPETPAKITRRYRGETLILETDIETADGAVTVIDFMPPGNGSSELVRIVVGRRGKVRMKMELVLRFDYNYYNDYSYTTTKDQIKYDAHLHLNNYGAALDWHPFAGVFLVSLGGWAIGMRNLVIYELENDSARYLRALGASERVVRGYAYRNASLPQLSGLALQLGVVIGGNIVTEIAFQYPGLGNLIFKAISNQDYFLLQGIFIFIVLGVLIANFIIDLVFISVDPRTRLSMQGAGA